VVEVWLGGRTWDFYGMKVIFDPYLVQFPICTKFLLRDLWPTFSCFLLLGALSPNFHVEGSRTHLDIIFYICLDCSVAIVPIVKFITVLCSVHCPSLLIVIVFRRYFLSLLFVAALCSG
jgi:hypothetical protein